MKWIALAVLIASTLSSSAWTPGIYPLVDHPEVDVYTNVVGNDLLTNVVLRSRWINDLWDETNRVTVSAGFTNGVFTRTYGTDVVAYTNRSQVLATTDVINMYGPFVQPPYTGNVEVTAESLERVSRKLEALLPSYSFAVYTDTDSLGTLSFDKWFENTMADSFPAGSKADLMFHYGGIGRVLDIQSVEVWPGMSMVTNGNPHWLKSTNRLNPMGIAYWRYDYESAQSPYWPNTAYVEWETVDAYQNEFWVSPSEAPRSLLLDSYIPMAISIPAKTNSVYNNDNTITGDFWIGRQTNGMPFFETWGNVNLTSRTNALPSNTVYAVGAITMTTNFPTVMLTYTGALTTYEGTHIWDSTLHPEQFDSHYRALTNLYLTPQDWCWTNSVRYYVNTNVWIPWGTNLSAVAVEGGYSYPYVLADGVYTQTAGGVYECEGKVVSGSGINWTLAVNGDTWTNSALEGIYQPQSWGASDNATVSMVYGEVDYLYQTYLTRYATVFPTADEPGGDVTTPIWWVSRFRIPLFAGATLGGDATPEDAASAAPRYFGVVTVEGKLEESFDAYAYTHPVEGDPTVWDATWNRKDKPIHAQMEAEAIVSSIAIRGLYAGTPHRAHVYIKAPNAPEPYGPETYWHRVGVYPAAFTTAETIITDPINIGDVLNDFSFVSSNKVTYGTELSYKLQVRNEPYVRTLYWTNGLDYTHTTLNISTNYAFVTNVASTEVINDEWNGNTNLFPLPWVNVTNTVLIHATLTQDIISTNYYTTDVTRITACGWVPIVESGEPPEEQPAQNTTPYTFALTTTNSYVTNLFEETSVVVEEFITSADEQHDFTRVTTTVYLSTNYQAQATAHIVIPAGWSGVGDRSREAMFIWDDDISDWYQGDTPFSRWAHYWVNQYAPVNEPAEEQYPAGARSWERILEEVATTGTNWDFGSVDARVIIEWQQD